MPIKLHCNHCEKFMRNATLKDTGEEICPECAGKINDTFKEVSNIEKRTTLAIKKIADKGREALEIALLKFTKNKGE